MAIRCITCTSTFFFLLIVQIFAQPHHAVIDTFSIRSDIRITVDRPANFNNGTGKNTIVIFFALPNGNSLAQTLGKKMKEGDDWHFDIQHIKAQTSFIRETDKKHNWIVICLENNFKSWPTWKQKHPDHKSEIPSLVDSLANLYGKKSSIYLNGHSGGGSFVLGYLAGMKNIPARIKRIGFIDSNYGYDSSYYPSIRKWLINVKGSRLSVFAYNDSIALLNGKPFVSATGGTWHRSHMMLEDLSNDFRFTLNSGDSIDHYLSNDGRVQFFFKKNLNRGIYHTQQVELNGFIHSNLFGTRYDEAGYKYYGRRAYTAFIE